MRKLTLLLAMAGLLAVTAVHAQTPGLKGNGQVFYTETFGWGNPADPKGWTAPAGYYFLDPLDIGYNWVWWPAGLGFVNIYTQDPPLNSTTKDNGCLALFVEEYNMQTGTLLSQNLDNSVVFPMIDCSSHSSVVVKYQTHFMAYCLYLNLRAEMYLEVTVDNWVHAASYNVNFGCGHKQRPLDKAKGEPALMEVNISDVAAGQPNVQMRLHWVNTHLYYWAVDDFTISEAYNNDLKLNYIKLEWEDGNPNTIMGVMANIPKSQLDGNNGFINFQSSALNFGEYDQEAVYMDIDITKNGNSVFHKMSEPTDVYTLVVDTADIADKYSPSDFGHYKINWEFKASQADDNPADNKRETFFNVTDSVYSRSDDTNDVGWSLSKEAYVTEATENIGHFAGSIFPIFNDCEVSSISTFIVGGKADELINYRFTLFFVPIGEEDETPYELLTTDMIQLDSADFNTWVTMELGKDGESEFLKKGDLVYAGIQYDNMNPDHLVRRNKGLEIGSDNSVRLTEGVAVGIYNGGISAGLDSYVGRMNLMCRLNLNDHSNRIDGLQNAIAAASLGQNYPNPFSRSTEIAYELIDGSNVTFTIMDLTGRKVMEVNKGMMPAGKHTYTLETNDLDPGVYFYTLKAGDFVQTKQMVISE
jgi:hypothetical protein